ncbi:heparan-sulfate 6-O-sulfotransferase 3-B-like [Haliotis cracherodii]|uniref:heparan-sulfate 6-O-sulfotransferase 3-B-like n=1 Tax=Haliotis cracherodii TaxID=6455 RepID=UPI0039ECAF57
MWKAMTRKVLFFVITVLSIIVWLTYSILQTRSNSFGFLKPNLPALKKIYPNDNVDAFNTGVVSSAHFSRTDLIHSFNVSGNGSDVIVFVRIQKTGSTTFVLHMVHDLDIPPWCQCEGRTKVKCGCYQQWKSNVLFTGERKDHPHIGHADWTVLHAWVKDAMKKRYGRKVKQRHLYVTMVRDPLPRYISEWKHVSRGATWSTTPFLCNGRSPTKEEQPPCFDVDWKNVTLHEFMECQSNLAVNRQTRMLANLSIVDCYNTSASGWTFDERQYLMLASAKENLKNMAFFGLTEYQELSQILFENTFNLTFTTKFKTKHLKYTSSAYDLTESDQNRIIHINRFDVILYQYAKDIFFQRLKYLASDNKQSHLRRLMRKLNI